jgi:hypothetical protein
LRIRVVTRQFWNQPTPIVAAQVVRRATPKRSTMQANNVRRRQETHLSQTADAKSSRECFPRGVLPPQQSEQINALSED